jgi:hypothetical protein
VAAGQCNLNIPSCSCCYQLQAIPKPQPNSFCLQGETASRRSAPIRQATFASTTRSHFCLPSVAPWQRGANRRQQQSAQYEQTPTLCIEHHITVIRKLSMLTSVSRSAWGRTLTTAAVCAKHELLAASSLQVS